MLEKDGERNSSRGTEYSDLWLAGLRQLLVSNAYLCLLCLTTYRVQMKKLTEIILHENIHSARFPRLLTCLKKNERSRCGGACL